MSAIKYSELKKRYELDGPTQTVRHLSEALQKNDLRPEDFSIRDLAETMIPNGRQWVSLLSPKVDGAVSVVESLEAVDASAFLNLTGQIIYNKILEAHKSESFMLSKAVTTVSTQLDGERIPGTAPIADEITEVRPGMPYPALGFSEDYIDTPPTAKHGLIVPVTREAIFFDRTHLILSRAAEVGEILALNKEKRIADMILGLTSLYKRKGTSYNTYYAGDSGDPWKNLLVSNELSAQSSVEAAENIFAEMTDPTSGEPILAEADTVLVMPAKRFTAAEIFASQKLTYSDGVLRSLDNPFGNYKIIASRVAYRQLLKTNPNNGETFGKYWFFGNFQKAFAYMENWPITVTHSNAGSEADFNQDIVVRFKASERGTPAVLNPQYVVKCTG